MPIEILVSAPNGSPCNYHEVKKVEVDYNDQGDGTVRVIVYSWANEASKAANNAPIWGWQLPAGGEGNQFALSDVIDIHTALVESPASPFVGGIRLLGGVVEIEHARRRKDIEIYRAFTQANEEPLVTPFGEFWTDPHSAFKITQVGAMAMALYLSDKPVEINFKDVNDQPVLLDFPKAIGLGLLMGQREQELRVILAERRAAIAAAQTTEEVQGISWASQTPPSMPTSSPAPAPSPAPAAMP